MSDIAICVENLGKKYLIRHQQQGRSYKVLRDVIAEKTVGLFKSLKPKGSSLKSQAQAPSSSSEDFWALNDVSFEIKQGEAVGIIGRNGAGKSTLLKLLSRITEPTKGRIELNGRVSSLLEVGTGFHPELTGRENIFLNGAVMGMHRAEIKRKFDEIVAFAEVEKFLDTPVKRYSSGMYMRLAFSVAAHLEPEILVVDEVLAVGDVEFQKKCLGKMESTARGEGRTVLFVSHNIGAITQICHRAILLEKGRMVCIGETGNVTSRYYESSNTQWSRKIWNDLKTAPGDDKVRLVSVRAINEDLSPISEAVDVRKPVGIEIQYSVLSGGVIFTPSLHLHDSRGTQIFLAIDLEKEWVCSPRPGGLYQSTAWIPGNFLNTGMHYVSVALSRLDVHVLHLFEQQVIAFNVLESMDENTARGIYPNSLPGVIRPILDWKTITPDPNRF